MDQKNVLASFPELSGFEPVTTVDELEAALARLPEDAVEHACNDKPIVAVNKSTQAIVLIISDPAMGLNGASKSFNLNDDRGA